MRIFTIIIFLALIPLGAKSFSYAQIHAMPKGIEKDYYIWRFLRQRSTTKAQARRIIREASRINPSLKKAYRRKTGHNPPPPPPKPKPRLSPIERVELKQKEAITMQVLGSPNPLAIWKRLDPRMKLFVFKDAGTKGRRRLDHAISQKEWQELSRYLDANLMIHYIRRDRLKKLSRIFRYKAAKDNKLRYDYLMQMAFSALKRGNRSLAEYNFALASRRAYKRDLADRALFWAWKVGGDRDYLKRLAKSWDINIYSLAARDELNMKYNLGITPKLPKTEPPFGFDIRNPIQWHYLKAKIFDPNSNLKNLAKPFKCTSTIGHYCYIMTQATKGKAQYFPMPYRSFIKRLPIKRQALIYAIARQESRFIPASVSTSFAIGMMQIMPFVIDEIKANRRELHIDYDDLFDPITALKFANTHLDYLARWLHHPLFVAYAYNAGIGFTKRLIRRKDFFENRSKYDPWMSIERVPNEEANDYGKRVLANYVIYMNKLGVPIRLKNLLSTLHLPRYTDRFRQEEKKKKTQKSKGMDIFRMLFGKSN